MGIKVLRENLMVCMGEESGLLLDTASNKIVHVINRDINLIGTDYNNMGSLWTLEEFERQMSSSYLADFPMMDYINLNFPEI